MWTAWWFRPVNIAARVGEHSAVVWNWFNRTPFAATRSSAGVGTGPPNVPHVPNPTSSSNTSTMFGASGPGIGIAMSPG
jgi:hypothetical protein